MKKIYYIPVKKENTELLRVAACCRVSTKKKTQLASLAHQIMAYAEKISDHSSWVYSGVFWDCGRSGLREKGHNGLRYMLESATEGKNKGDMMLQKTFTEDYLNGIRKKNVGQRTRY